MKQVETKHTTTLVDNSIMLMLVDITSNTNIKLNDF